MDTGPTASLAREFFLRRYLDERGRMPHYLTGLDLGLAGAVLMDLAEAASLRVQDGCLHVVGDVPGPEHEDAGARVLRRIAAEPDGNAEYWVRSLARCARRAVYDDLVRSAAILPVPRALGVVPRRSVDVAAALEPRLRDPRSAGRLAALASACGFDTVTPPFTRLVMSHPSDYTQYLVLDAVSAGVRSMSVISPV